jgi:predicted amidohydrolase
MASLLAAILLALAAPASAALVTVESPGAGATVGASAVALSLLLDAAADPSTLDVRLNRTPITDRLVTDGARRTAVLTGVPGRTNALRRGTNRLEVTVAPAAGTPETVQVRFRWRPDTTRLHLIVVGNRIDFAAYTSFATWQAEVDRIFRDLVRPHLKRGRPNLVVLTEDFGLPAGTIGSRGAGTRANKDADPLTALSGLLVTYGPQLNYYLANFTLPGTGIQPLARALVLALTDTLTRAFVPVLSAAAQANGVWLIACTNVAPSTRSTDPADVAFFGDVDDPARTDVYLPVGIDVYNTAYFWGPDGALVGTTRKVNLTPPEVDLLNLSNGALDDVHVFDLPIGRIGIAISLDAFLASYVGHLDRQGAVLVVQPDANPGQWANAVGSPDPDDWQPDEWLDSIMGMLGPAYPNIHYNATSMMTGNFFPGTLDPDGNPTGLVFDGQSTVTRRATRPPRKGFVGTLPPAEIRLFDSQPMRGRFLAVSPWAFPDPATLHSAGALDALLDRCASAFPRGRRPRALTLAERQQIMLACADSLVPGGANPDAYAESVVTADVRLPVAAP